MAKGVDFKVYNEVELKRWFERSMEEMSMLEAESKIGALKVLNTRSPVNWTNMPLPYDPNIDADLIYQSDYSSAAAAERQAT